MMSIDHPEDVAVRESLPALFRRLRHAAGKTLEDAADACGDTTSWRSLSAWELGGTSNSKIIVHLTRFRAIGHRMLVSLDRLPGYDLTPDIIIAEAMMRSDDPRRADMGAAMFLPAVFAAIRWTHGVPMAEVAGRAGWTVQTLRSHERATNPRIATVQRLARAYGGVARIDVVGFLCSSVEV